MSNTTTTQKGDKAYKSTLNSVLDFFFHAPATRLGGSQNQLPEMFAKALAQDTALAISAMFYLRDVRGGQGERDSFRLCLETLRKKNRALFDKLVPLVPEYGRWDDILPYVDNPAVVSLVMSQLSEDFANMAASKPISLLAKWMPSINTSSKTTVALARKWSKAMSLSEATYRKNLSQLRKYLDVVEVRMSSGDWDNIKFETVPSKAAMIYRKAFEVHQPERYVQYIKDVMSGEKKINSSTLFPYEIVHNIMGANASDCATLEALWKSLPNYCESDKNALVVADVSGSMHGTPLEVAISLALYIAERNTGAFHNTFITFSESPTLQVIAGNTLKEKVNNLSRADWDMSTDVSKVFDLILNSALSNKLPQSELPETLFIVSDMQFDSADSSGNSAYSRAKKTFEANGYTLPKLVFWNVRAVPGNVPVTINDSGVYLVSGNSPTIFQKAVNTVVTSPEDLMKEVLLSERYLPVISAVN